MNFKYTTLYGIDIKLFENGNVVIRSWINSKILGLKRFYRDINELKVSIENNLM